MQYAKIPGLEQEVSRICLGTMTFGSPVSETDAVKLIAYAKEEHGINFIDTANMYEGYNRFAGSAGGVAEEIVGRTVHGHRTEFVLATKVGMKVGQAPEDEGTSPKAIAAQLRRSLQRMGTDYVDIYYLHCYDANTPPHEIVRAIARELKAGTIRAWGVSNYTAPQLQALLEAANEENVPAPALCQPQLNLLNQEALQALLPLCAKAGIGVVPYQVLQGGILTGKYHKGAAAPAGSRLAEKPEWVKPLTDDVYKILAACEQAAQEEGVSMTQYALRWALRQQGVVSALIGVKRASQIDEAACAVAP